jgi:NAD(P)-dependent dehydrogenase (short-subunit alcohol dehydrogenase family)
MEIKNKLAIVTGGASGMGFAVANSLSQKGMRVVTWDIQSNPTQTFEGAYQCDVTLEHEVESILNETVARFGGPSVLVNCAGIAPAKRMVTREGPQPLAEFKKVIDVNLIGTFNVMRLVADAMIKANHPGESKGVIINTASVAAFEGQIGQLAYSASKGGIVSMTLPAARELASHGIRINTICPGLIATPLLLNMPQEVQASLAASVTFPKRLGTPEEFASLVLSICENDYLNGEVIRLDGAIRMQAK